MSTNADHVIILSCCKAGDTQNKNFRLPRTSQFADRTACETVVADGFAIKRKEKKSWDREIAVAISAMLVARGKHNEIYQRATEAYLLKHRVEWWTASGTAVCKKTAKRVSHVADVSARCNVTHEILIITIGRNMCKRNTNRSIADPTCL